MARELFNVLVQMDLGREGKYRQAPSVVSVEIQETDGCKATYMR
jgi:hypothetical protein